MGDITAANATIILTVPGLLTVAQQLQGFAADDVFDVEDVDSGETLMGVDGILSGGMIFAKTGWTITFQADSPSIPSFETWDLAQQNGLQMFPGVLNVTLTAINRSYQAAPAFLVRLKRMPNAKRVLQPRKFRLDLGSIIPIPVGAAG